MTVKELIERLKDFPEDMEVILFDNRVEKVTSVERSWYGRWDHLEEQREYIMLGHNHEMLGIHNEWEKNIDWDKYLKNSSCSVSP